MFKIQTLNTIASVGLNQLPHNQYEVASEMLHPDAILVRSQSLHHTSIPESVKAIGRAGAGVNNIPVNEMTKRGIPVFNTPGANANAVRELVLAGMFLASRNICQAWNYVNQLRVDEPALHHEIEKNKKQFVGFELMGKTLGIIGLGSVGVKVANAAINLGMQVIGYDPTITVHRAWELSSNVQQAHNIDELLIHADFVSVHVPLNDMTRNMLNSSRLQMLKEHAVLLNFAREEIVDIDALISVLQSKKLLAYVSDFPNTQLRNFAQVISLPHLGASTREAEENCAVMIAKQIRDFFEIGMITNAVNFPTVEIQPLIKGTRLVIVNANVPNMVAQISSSLAAEKLNIQSLTNKSLQDIAYTLIDLETDVEPAVLKSIAKVEGVIQVRSIIPEQNC